jgi:hypothetical protein
VDELTPIALAAGRGDRPALPAREVLVGVIGEYYQAA